MYKKYRMWLPRKMRSRRKVAPQEKCRIYPSSIMINQLLLLLLMNINASTVLIIDKPCMNEMSAFD